MTTPRIMDFQVFRQSKLKMKRSLELDSQQCLGFRKAGAGKQGS